ncbi:hypothetical protein D3C87_1746840 [compost metagenome]
MGKCVGNYPPLRFLLKLVVTNGIGRGQGSFQIAWFEDLVPLIGVIGPYARQKIGLQFQLHRQLVILGLAQPAALLLHLLRNTHQVLYVVPYLVRHHVSDRELARRIEPVAKFVAESEVDINFMIGRAVEWSHGR